MRVLNDMTVSISNLHANKEFKSMVEQNIDLNIKLGRTTIKTITPNAAYMYQGNFYGLLRALNISPDYHAFIAYVNNVRSPHDFDGKTYAIRIIDESVVDNVGRITF